MDNVNLTFVVYSNLIHLGMLNQRDIIDPAYEGIVLQVSGIFRLQKA